MPDDRRWFIHHPISGPSVAKAPDDGVYGIPYGEGLWVVPESELEAARERKSQTDDGQYFLDGFIGEVIGIDRLRHFKIDASGEGIVLASVTFWKTFNDQPLHFSGSGKTMGFALANLREHIREHYGR
jgi:hypothetical protein